jgi:hypothetical protein
MARQQRPSSQTWRTFLNNHVKELVSTDFFVVPTLSFRVLFVFLVLAHHRRRVIHWYGRHNKLPSPSRGTLLHATCCMIATPSSVPRPHPAPPRKNTSGIPANLTEPGLVPAAPELYMFSKVNHETG